MNNEMIVLNTLYSSGAKGQQVKFGEIRACGIGVEA